MRKSVAFLVACCHLFWVTTALAPVITTNPSSTLNLAGISKQCRQDLLQFIHNVSSSDMEKPNWADFMLDSHGLDHAGIIHGNSYGGLGDFYGCVNLHVQRPTTSSINSSSHFDGQYCLGISSSTAIKPQMMHFGTCSPSSCTSNDLEIFYKQYIKPSTSFNFTSEFCQTRHHIQMDDTSIGICAMIAFFLVLILIGTLYDVRCDRIDRIQNTDVIPSQKNGKLKSLLLAFSLTRNVKSVFSIESSEDDLVVLHGIRAISMIYIIFGHAMSLVTLSIPWKNQMIVFDMFRSYNFALFDGSEFAVDSFLFISGYLTCYIFLLRLQSQNFTFKSYILYIFHRLWRLWPSYLIVLAIVSGPVAYLSTGPIAPGVFVDRETCRQSWWKDALFIRIYFNDSEVCLMQTWYMCLDMVYAALFPLILYPLHKKPIVGYAIFTILLISSFLTSGILIYKGEMEPLIVMDSDFPKRISFTEQVYNKPWCRIPASLIGLAFGYIFHLKPKGIKFRPMFVCAMWISVAVLGPSLILGVKPYISSEKAMSLAFKVSYGTFSRPSWCICLGWVVLACSYGYGGFVNSILSWKGFIPMSRLSYCTYLLHVSVIGVFISSLKDTTYMDDAILYYIYMTIAVVSNVAALVLNLIIEGPFCKLEKILLHRK